MADSASEDFIDKVARVLGRSERMRSAPTPPVLDEAIIRLVKTNASLPDLFMRQASQAKMMVEIAAPEQLAGLLVEFLKSRSCQSVGLAVSPLFDRLNFARALRIAGFDVKSWADLTLDGAFDLDCGITDVFAAVAETGSLVIRPDPQQGRALSLVPPIHVAIVEPARIVPDLVDLLANMSADPSAPNFTLITGPSKTADIEGVLVTGVHGPGIVKVFVVGE